MFAQLPDHFTVGRSNNKNLAIANRSRVRCAHNTLRASIGINNYTVTLKSK